ncbi:zinc finger protein Noc-like [Cloeon dipterum]|uniref:zinc finger protein Noc-like n=1 Tax=Cloeon dipterum TaxID=197152 RepID=UPI003220219D
MLTSSSNASNQYLRPEYLTPLPTTLDAKKSPLALLAQTCSQIGADCPNTKPLLPPLDKSHKKSESRDKVSPATNDSSSNSTTSASKSVASFKPYETTKEVDVSGRCSTGRSKTPQSSKSVTPNNNNNNTIVASANGPTTTRSPTTSPAARKTPSEGKERTSPVSSKAAAFSSLITGESKDSTPSGFKPSPPSSSSSAAALAAAAAAAASMPPGFLGYPHLNDLALSSLMFGKAHPGLSPYLSYSRMKTPGAEHLMQVCRDPYCTGCTLSSHLLKGGATPSSTPTPTTPTSTASTAPSCPSGCVTCDHQKGAGSPSSALGAAAALSLPHLNPLLASPYASPLSAHLPYVCNWIAGDNYCGKRFTSSEELLQHLRSHTNLTESLSASMQSHPLLASHAAAMAALHRTYPTPPLSPLAAARYHPYSKPPLPPSLSAAFPLHPHPGVPPYFSPYSIYGRAASGMHP